MKLTQDGNTFQPEEKNNESIDVVDLPEEKGPKNPIYSGFFRRLFAAIIDLLLLGVIGMLIIWLGKPLLNWLDIWEWSVGFIVFMAYFAIQNSYLCKGQTIGKRILGIQVVNRQGDYLTLKESLLRAGIFSVIYFADNWSKMNDGIVFSSIFSVFLLLFSVATVYLVIFNRPTRQVVHDLVVHSYVVRVGQVPEEIGEIKFKRHGVALIAISLVLISGFFFVQFKGIVLMQYFLTDQFSGVNVVELQKEIEPLIADTIAQNSHLEKNVKSYQVTLISYSGYNTAGNTNRIGMQIALHWRGPINATELKKAVSALFDNKDLAMYQYDFIMVRMYRSYDIGIATASLYLSINTSPEDWQTTIDDYDFK